MSLVLNPQTSAALKRLMDLNQGQLPTAVEQALVPWADAKAGKPLELDELERLLNQAMPGSSHIKEACQCGSSYHPDGKNPQFMTEFLNLTVTKINEVRAVFNVPVARVDPYAVELDLAPNAKFTLLFNTQDVDEALRPLLMKVVMRMDPRTEGVVTTAENEISDHLRDMLASIHTVEGTPEVRLEEVKAACGLRSDGADMGWVDWIKGARCKADPALAALLEQVVTKTAAVNEIKEKYIKEQLPTIKLEQYRTLEGSTPDVDLVGAKVLTVKVQDFNEPEVAFGNRLKQVSQSASGREISSSLSARPVNVQKNRAWTDATKPTQRRPGYDTVATADNLDRMPVITFPQRISLRLNIDPKQVPPGAWLNDKIPAAALEATLHIGRGVAAEPGAHVQVVIAGGNLEVVVPEDPQMLGNAPASVVLNLGEAPIELGLIFSGGWTHTSWAQPEESDRTAVRGYVRDLAFPKAAALGGAAGQFIPQGEHPVARRDMAAKKLQFECFTIPDEDQDAVKVRLTVGEGFRTGKKGEVSLEGWKFQVGYRDANNAWVAVGEQQVKHPEATEKALFEFKVDDVGKLTGPRDQYGDPTKHLEIRLWDNHGVPAERFLLAFKDLEWGTTGESKEKC